MERIVKSLRIKKIYFDEIKAGSKKIEYREKKPYYDSRLRKKLTHIIFHYQKSAKILVEVKSIRVINAPKKLIPEMKKLNFKNTKKIYAITLGRSRTLRR